MKWTPLLTSLTTLCLLQGVWSCDAAKKQDQDAPQDAPQDMTAAAPSAAKPVKRLPPRSVREAVDAVVAHCTLDDKHAPTQCAHGEVKALQKFIGGQRMKSLPGLLDELAKEDQTRRHIAGYAFKAYVPYFLGDADKKDYTIRGDDKRAAPIDEALAKRMLELASHYDPDTDHLAMFTLDATLDMATLAGLDSEARAFIRRFDPAKSAAQQQLFYKGMNRVMRFGRMRFFEDVKAMIDHEIPTLQLIAFEAPQLMSAWNNGESETICQWAGEMMRLDKPQWNAGPARLLLRCNEANTWRNILLDEATRRYNAGTLAQPFTSALCRVCAPAVHNLYPPGGKTVCDRGEKFFIKITTDSNKRLKSDDRKVLLRCMFDQWSNRDALDHLDAMTRDADKGVASIAKMLWTTHGTTKESPSPGVK